jgi:ssDNA-binding Zn-finger/Zn-ribbon topoisomerase 1
MKQVTRYLALGLALLIGCSLLLLAVDWWWSLPAGLVPQYVGRDECVDCHAAELAAWLGSDHDLAMDLATPRTVLGDFNNRQFTHFGVTSRMFRRGEKFFIETEGPDGKLASYEIKYTFGVRPLQQYMVEFPRGHIQVLSIAWDTERRRWFHLYPDERIEPDDWLHWTRAGQRWNDMCADCHSTNVHKNYDAETDTYNTTWSEIDVSCEACHGPASIHVKLARSRSLFWDRRYGTGLANLGAADPTIELEKCAQCHSRRRLLKEDFQPGESFYDHYGLSLLERGLYHADGQIIEEVYVFGSFLQSRMYRAGVRCTDCHKPHSLRLHAEGNALCTRCHLAGQYDTRSHRPGRASRKPRPAWHA